MHSLCMLALPWLAQSIEMENLINTKQILNGEISFEEPR